MGLSSIADADSTQLSLAGIANLADNQSQLRELDDFIETAEGQVPQVRPPRKRSPLELILQTLQPVAQAFASSQAARPRDRRRAFLGALASGGAALGLREVARPSLEREAQAQAEEARGMAVLDAALKEQREERRLRVVGRPRSLQEVEASRVSRGESTTEESAARLRVTPPVNVIFDDQGRPFTVSSEGEFAPATQVFQRSQLGLPPVIGPLIRSDQTFAVQEPTEFRTPSATQRFTLGPGQRRVEKRPGEEPEIIARGAPITRRPTQGQLKRDREQAARGTLIERSASLASSIFPNIDPNNLDFDQKLTLFTRLRLDLQSEETPENTLEIQAALRILEKEREKFFKQNEEDFSIIGLSKKINTAIRQAGRRGQ